MTANDGGDGSVYNFVCREGTRGVPVRFARRRDVPLVCLRLYGGKGAEGSRFQDQQADESLGPNSLEAKLALLLSL